MRTSLLTQSLKDYDHQINQLQQLSRPAPHAEQIRNITLSYQSKPSQKHDGKDWARSILENQSKHHELAIKWARQVLNGEK